MTRIEALRELGLDETATTADRRIAFFSRLAKHSALTDRAAFGRLYAAHQCLEREGPAADAKGARPATEAKPAWQQWFDQSRPTNTWKFLFPMLLVGGFLAMRGRRTEREPAAHVASTPATPQEAQQSIDSILEIVRGRTLPAFETELASVRQALSGTSCDDAQHKVEVALDTFAAIPIDLRSKAELPMERVRGGVDALCRSLAKPH